MHLEPGVMNVLRLIGMKDFPVLGIQTLVKLQHKIL